MIPWAFVCGGLLLGLAALPLLRRLAPDRGFEPCARSGRALAGAFGAIVLFALTVFALRKAFGPEDVRALLFANLLGAAYGGLFLEKGRRFGRVGGDVLRGVAAYALCLPAVAAVNAANVLVAPSRAGRSHEILDLLADGALDVRFFVASTTVVVAVPLFEEIFARGLLQRAAAAQFAALGTERRAKIVAVVFASIAFTALHPPETYLPVFSLSLVLGVLALRTGGVAAAVGFHAAHNAFAIFYERNLSAIVAKTGLFPGAH